MADAPSTLEPRAVTRDVFSASIGSVCCCYVGQPFDTGMSGSAFLSSWFFEIAIGEVSHDSLQ